MLEDKQDRCGANAFTRFDGWAYEARIPGPTRWTSDQPCDARMAMKSFSTFVLAHGVFRRNFRLDFSEGSLVKQRILIRFPSSFQP
jgi:hypothetical protein